MNFNFQNKTDNNKENNKNDFLKQLQKQVKNKNKAYAEYNNLINKKNT